MSRSETSHKWQLVLPRGCGLFTNLSHDFTQVNQLRTIVPFGLHSEVPKKNLFCPFISFDSGPYFGFAPTRLCGCLRLSLVGAQKAGRVANKKSPP